MLVGHVTLAVIDVGYRSIVVESGHEEVADQVTLAAGHVSLVAYSGQAGLVGLVIDAESASPAETVSELDCSQSLQPVCHQHQPLLLPLAKALV